MSVYHGTSALNMRNRLTPYVTSFLYESVPSNNAVKSNKIIKRYDIQVESKETHVKKSNGRPDNVEVSKR